MRHERHYTIEQANAVRGWVAERVGWVRLAQTELAELGAPAIAVLRSLDEQLGGSYPGREAARPLVELSRAFGELDAVDIVLRDAERGLIDFPSIRNGEEVYLCWLVDEDEVGFWHPPDAGFAGRRPL